MPASNSSVFCLLLIKFEKWASLKDARQHTGNSVYAIVFKQRSIKNKFIRHRCCKSGGYKRKNVLWGREEKEKWKKCQKQIFCSLRRVVGNKKLEFFPLLCLLSEVFTKIPFSLFSRSGTSTFSTNFTWSIFVCVC